jgi:pyrroline-5-carboxylate reductase
MQIGLIGAGNMARALARGWGEPVLCTDGGSGRARELAAELGGEALADNAELAERADVVVLCHKPGQLAQVAERLAGRARAVVSALGGTPLAALRLAYPDTPLLRIMPNLPVEVGRGVVCAVPAPDIDADLLKRLSALFARLGEVVTVPESQIDAATALAGCGPAFLALVAEAQVDAGVRHGLPADLAGRLVGRTLDGTAALLRARGGDTLAVRREVSSPGGSTVRGLEALERAGLRPAFADAVRAVVRG